MNKRIYKILENDINDYQTSVRADYGSNNAIFEIFDYFLHKLHGNKEIEELSGIKLKSIMKGGLLSSQFDIPENSHNDAGVTFILEFDNVEYALKFIRFKANGEMHYQQHINSIDSVKYSNDFIYKYFLYNALEYSNLKGSYFTMPRNSFKWDIKTMEPRSFDDIYLPKQITKDLKLFVNIYNDSEKILRYLKVGNPGVGKTESTIVIANELNKLGVTIIKTPICDLLHKKVELANVLAPALIIFDDIDLSLGDRNKGAYNSLLGDFLDVLDGTDKLADNVGIIATTNAAHLLDLAAQRPGRFDKTLLFDNITRKNIKDIIAKSLKMKFDITSGDEYDSYTHKTVVEKFYTARVTGSHVYNAIKMLKLRYDSLSEEVTVDNIIEDIEAELVTIEKVRKTQDVTEKFKRGNSSIGFGSARTEEEDDDEYEDSYDEEVEVTIPSDDDNVGERIDNGEEMCEEVKSVTESSHSDDGVGERVDTWGG